MAEKINALTSLFARTRELIADWGKRSATEDDAAALACANYYHELCRWLDQSMSCVEGEIQSTGVAVDLTPLREARDELRVILGFKPADLIKGRADARGGRVITLDEMRRELQGRGH